MSAIVRREDEEVGEKVGGGGGGREAVQSCREISRSE